MAKVSNLERVLARLAKVPASIKEAAARQLLTEVGDLVAAQKRAAPVDDGSDNPGALRDSLHFYENPRRPLSYIILGDAKDEDGKFIGSNIDAGHRTKDGKHVPGAHFFFTTYRARKKPMRRRLSAASRKAAKAAFPG